MCGGIAFDFTLVTEDELKSFLPPDEFSAFKKMREVQSFFWSARPILPVTMPDAVHLYDWGNREKSVDLPRTGWVRIESYEEGRWKHLEPKEIVIPASRGYEKKVWFNISTGIEGILVEKEGVHRVYMLTQPADRRYQNLTKHDRMPKFI